MNELINLSNDINIITAEIKSYQQIAGQSIFEIGKRLKHVKENDLVHGQWIKWLKEIGMDRGDAYRFIQTYEEFKNNDGALQHLNQTKIFHIVTLPKSVNRVDFIESQHEIPSTGEEKTVYEMTTRELAEVKKELKEKEKLLQKVEQEQEKYRLEIERAKQSEQQAVKQLEEIHNQEPQIIEKEIVKEVEVVPESLLSELERVKEENQQIKDSIKFKELKDDAVSKSEEDIELDESSMSYMANKNVYNLIAYMDSFLKDAVVSSLMRGSIANANDTTKTHLDSRIEAFQEFINDLKIAKTGRKIN